MQDADQDVVARAEGVAGAGANYEAVAGELAQLAAALAPGTSRGDALRRVRTASDRFERAQKRINHALQPFGKSAAASTSSAAWGSHIRPAGPQAHHALRTLICRHFERVGLASVASEMLREDSSLPAADLSASFELQSLLHSLDAQDTDAQGIDTQITGARSRGAQISDTQSPESQGLEPQLSSAQSNAPNSQSDVRTLGSQSSNAQDASAQIPAQGRYAQGLGAPTAQDESSPLTAWVGAHRALLDKHASPLPTYIAELRFFEVLIAHGDAPALALLRSYAAGNEVAADTVERLAGAIPLRGTPVWEESCNYITTLRQLTKSQLVHDLWLLNKGAPAADYLSEIIEASLVAIPVLDRLSPSLSHSSWTARDELPAEIPLPPGLVHHPIFVCPVLKEQTTGAPARLLPCGHVLSTDAYIKLAKSQARSHQECPYCPKVFDEEEVYEVQFIQTKIHKT